MLRAPVSPKGRTVDNIEEFVVIDKRIDTAVDEASALLGESIRDRWEFGKLMLAQRKGKQLPNGVLDELAERTGKSRAELKFRMQFAERYPTEDEVARALATCTSWTQIKKNLPKPPTKQRKSERDAQIAALKEQGKTRTEIAEAIGINPRNIDNAVRANRAAEQAREEALLESIDYATAPASAQAKIDAMVRRRTRELEKEFRTRVLAEVDQARAKLLEDLAAHKAQLDERNQKLNALRNEERRRYQLGIEAQQAKGLITPDEYNVIRSCLHPDSRASATEEKLAAAFRLFNDSRIKLLLVKEK